MHGNRVERQSITAITKPITWKATPSTYERRLHPKRASPAEHRTDYVEGKPSIPERRLRPKRASPASHQTDRLEGDTFHS